MVFQHFFALFFVYYFSILGHRIPDIPVPLFNVYPASKFALTALTQTIRQELVFQRANIKLTVCCHQIRICKKFTRIFYFWRTFFLLYFSFSFRCINIYIFYKTIFFCRVLVLVWLTRIF